MRSIFQKCFKLATYSHFQERYSSYYLYSKCDYSYPVNFFLNCNLLATYKHFYFLKKKINIDFKLQIFLLFVVKLIILLYTGVHLICGIIQVFRIFFTFDHNNRFWVLFLHFRKSSLYRNVKTKLKIYYCDQT